jgi:hypothetical protein
MIVTTAPAVTRAIATQNNLPNLALATTVPPFSLE